MYFFGVSDLVVGQCTSYRWWCMCLAVGFWYCRQYIST